MGVFLGYRFSPGQEWKGECLVAWLEQFKGALLHRDAPSSEFKFVEHITKVVRLPEGIDAPLTFPCKRTYNYDNDTLEGLNAPIRFGETEPRPPRGEGWGNSQGRY